MLAAGVLLQICRTNVDKSLPGHLTVLWIEGTPAETEPCTRVDTSSDRDSPRKATGEEVPGKTQAARPAPEG